MASTQRERELALGKQLVAEAPTFSFFQAVRLLERLSPNAAAVGELGPPNKEALRFLHDPSLAFRTSDITAIQPRVLRNGVPYVELMTSFFGLLGTVSPLAMYMTEDVLRTEEDEGPLQAFYDLFHHRLLSLFYRTKKKYSFGTGFRTDGSDPFTRRALGFVGVDAHSTTALRGLSPPQLLGLAHLLALPTRPARSLTRILEGLLPKTAVEITTFIGRRVLLADDQIAKLGTQSSTLGVDMTIGRGVLDRSARFRVGLGPLSQNMFQALLPGGPGYASLRQVIEQFSRSTLESEVELTLAEGVSIFFQLGGKVGSTLGVTTVLASKNPRPGKARFVLSDATTATSSVMVDGQAVRSVR
jgi:type VI secretion system protein ImpH